MEVTSPITDLNKTADAAMVLIPGDVAMWCVAGSHLYGVATFKSDLDMGFMYVRPTDQLVGVHPVSEKAHTTTGMFEVGSVKADFKAHEAGKFCRLLLKGNPEMIEWLFATPEWHFHPWKALRERRMEFITQRVISQYLGYLDGQLRKLAENKPLHTTGGQYNTKWAYHVARLSRNLVSLSFKHEPKLTATGTWRTYLQDIRAGKVPKADVVADAEVKMAEAKRNRRLYKIPEEAPVDFLNEWLLGLRKAMA